MDSTEVERATTEALVFRPNVVQRFNGVLVPCIAAGMLFVVAASRDTLDAPSAFVIFWFASVVFAGLWATMRGWWFRLTVDDSTVVVRNFRTTEIECNTIVRIVLEDPSEVRFLGADTRMSIEIANGDRHGVKLMRRYSTAIEWMDSFYDRRVEEIANAIECPVERQD